MKSLIIVLAVLAIGSLEACGGGDDTHTSERIETHTVEIKPQPIAPVDLPKQQLPDEAPIDTTPPVVLPPTCKPDPQPTHGKDPACR